MVIIHAYMRRGNNVIACLPFYFDDEKEEVIGKEYILDYNEDVTLDNIKHELSSRLETEKHKEPQYGKDEPARFTGDSPCITIY